MNTTVLIADDDPSLLLSLQQLVHTEYVVAVASSGKETLRKLARDHYDCLLLDFNMPDMDGLDVCRHLRHAGNMIQIIMLSGNDEPSRIASLLDAGADDYIVKPARPVELLARIRAATRRARQPRPAGSRLEIGDVILDSTTHSVSRDGTVIPLRPKEFALLECLMMSAGRVISRPILLRYAWDENADVWTNVVDVHIKYLRDKFDLPFNHYLIKTVHGIGYKFDLTAVAKYKKGGTHNERLTASRPG